MKVSAIHLDNFRGVPRLDLTLDPNMTIIVGRNGLGKSSILDALSIMLYYVNSAWSREKQRLIFPPGVIKPADIMIGSDDYQLILDFKVDDIIGTEVEQSIDLRLSDEMHFSERKSLDRIRKFIQSETLSTANDTLLLYYRQDRGFDDDRGVVSRRSDTNTFLFGPLRAISQLESWWDKRDAEEARHVRDVDRNYRDPQLQAVRDLIMEIDGFVGIEYHSTSDPEGLYFKREDEARIHVSALSTGERSFIILLADLARRLQFFQPKLSLDKISGIVLIDEIELNLHPSWQSKIISTLQRVFKSCQFVVTTHSPQVISSVESIHVRSLLRDEGAIVISQPLRTKGQTSNYLLEGVFGAHERYPEIDMLIDSFNLAIDNHDENRATNLFNEIMLQVEGDPPELLVLRKRLRGLRKSQ